MTAALDKPRLGRRSFLSGLLGTVAGAACCRTLIPLVPENATQTAVGETLYEMVYGAGGIPWWFTGYQTFIPNDQFVTKPILLADFYDSVPLNNFTSQLT